MMQSAHFTAELPNQITVKDWGAKQQACSLFGWIYGACSKKDKFVGQSKTTTKQPWAAERSKTECESENEGSEMSHVTSAHININSSASIVTTRGHQNKSSGLWTPLALPSTCLKWFRGLPQCCHWGVPLTCFCSLDFLFNPLFGQY